MAIKMKMKNVKASAKVVTPVGRLLWLNLAEPKPSDSAMNADKYTCTVAWDKSGLSPANTEAAKEVFNAVLKVGRDAYGDDTLKLSDIPQSVIKDGASMENQSFLADMYVCSATTGIKFPPSVYGPVKSRGSLPKDEVAGITQGDYGRMVITVAAYSVPSGNGITCYLSSVQFAKKGEYLGNDAGYSMIDDLTDEEIGLDDLALEEPKEEEKSSTKTPSKKAAAKKEVENEKTEDDNFDELFSL